MPSAERSRRRAGAAEEEATILENKMHACGSPTANPLAGNF